jgi:hypothetical protein
MLGQASKVGKSVGGGRKKADDVILQVGNEKVRGLKRHRQQKRHETKKRHEAEQIHEIKKVRV